MQKYLFSGILLFSFFALQSQGTVNEVITRIIEENNGDPEEISVSENLSEILHEYHSRPPDLNQVTREQLEEMRFLSGFQIHAFLEYRERYGRIYSFNELNLIPGLHLELIRNLRFFTRLSEEEPSHKRKKVPLIPSNHRIISRIEIPLHSVYGFDPESEKELRFKGANMKRLIKYEGRSGKWFRTGLTLESDPGEVFFSPGKAKVPSDFRSFYLEMDHPHKLLDQLIIGDFRAGFGSGLVYGYGRRGKSSNVSFGSLPDQIKKYASTGESGFLRGIALKSSFDKMSFYLLASSLKEDARINSEDFENRSFVSIQEGGLHRNEKELAVKNTLSTASAGIALIREVQKGRLGMVASGIRYFPRQDLRIRPDRYSETEFISGILNGSAFYSFRLKKGFLEGEIAFSRKLKVAVINRLDLQLHSLIRLSMAWRYYSPENNAPFASAFGETRGVRNEKGFYLGMDFFPYSFLHIKTYLDIYAFPWLRYNDDRRMAGNELALYAEWYNGGAYRVNGLFKMEMKSEFPGMITRSGTTTDESTMQFRLQFDYEPFELISFKTRFERKGISQDQNGNKGFGVLAFQELTWEIPKAGTGFHFRYTLFNISDWEDRIYSWEHDLLYSFSTVAYYRQGHSWLFSLRCKMGEKIRLGVKYSRVTLEKKAETGSGADFFTGSRKGVLKVQLILKAG